MPVQIMPPAQPSPTAGRYEYFRREQELKKVKITMIYADGFALPENSYVASGELMFSERRIYRHFKRLENMSHGWVRTVTADEVRQAVKLASSWLYRWKNMGCPDYGPVLINLVVGTSPLRFTLSH